MATDSMELQASRLLARLDAAGPTPELVEAIRAWRELDPRHDAAFLKLQKTWARLDRLGPVRESVASAPLSRPRRATFGRRVGGWGIAASVLLTCLWFGGLWSERSDRYATAIGDFERVALADGSIVEMNTDSEIRVSLDAAARRVELIKGEALFTVAPEPGRPFVVAVDGAAVRAVGTQFKVRRLDEQAVEVLVTEGKVTLTPSREATAAPLLSAGQKGLLAHGFEPVVRNVPATQLNRELAWKTGMLVFAGETLQEAVQELNRYNPRQLSIDDPSISELAIGGYFNARNLDGFIAVLESDFGVEAVATGDRLVLRGARKRE